MKVSSKIYWHESSSDILLHINTEHDTSWSSEPYTYQHKVINTRKASHIESLLNISDTQEKGTIVNCIITSDNFVSSCATSCIFSYITPAVVVVVVKELFGQTLCIYLLIYYSMVLNLREDRSKVNKSAICDILYYYSYHDSHMTIIVDSSCGFKDVPKYVNNHVSSPIIYKHTQKLIMNT